LSAQVFRGLLPQKAVTSREFEIRRNKNEKAVEQKM
jgi:hypothetical protein